ncbi:MAG: hypothetical protein ACOY0T_30160 [Myxococcota bacterium]
MHLVIRIAKWSLLGLSLALSGCGGDDDKKSGGNPETFIGTWNVTSGTVTLGGDCGNETSPLMGSVVFTKGSTSDLVANFDDCPLKFDVSGNNATAQGGQNCTVSDSGFTGTLTYSSLIFSSSDAKVATVSGSGTIQLTGGGLTIACTQSITGSLQKL